MFIKKPSFKMFKTASSNKRNPSKDLPPRKKYYSYFQKRSTSSEKTRPEISDKLSGGKTRDPFHSTPAEVDCWTVPNRCSSSCLLMPL
ncbi:hypothetical protein CDAR_304461 [Caerostris darwini]|uniref:Uncharacterized protein n=1 Tax=Caerostris darwini TaxID=1538125 RepID=A0AAV4NKB0_9ARAC|nr:hypothetical protein CDAR_304461 [Caerostris darwini]